MSKVSYQDVSDIFSQATVWVDGYEEFWYHYAWNILDEVGYTKYDNDADYYKIILSAVALTKVYDKFCDIAFDQGESIYTPDLTEDITDLVLGQLVRALLPGNKLFEDRDAAMETVIHLLCFDVLAAIKKRMTESEVFAYMYCTAYSPETEEWFDEETGEYAESDEPVIETLEDYKKFVKDSMDAVLNETDGDKLEAFDFVCGLME